MLYGQDEEQIERHLVHCLEMHDGESVVRGASCPLGAAERGGRHRARIPAARTDLCIPGSSMSGSQLPPLMHCYFPFVRICENRIEDHVEATSRGMQDVLDRGDGRETAADTGDRALARTDQGTAE